ncbi:uncharacterized protein LOC121372210 [Gigantopelta aegis]|uniref:uncharacterized protein LOC121372210 n=1 Tax=Gigantopelta aegis TaxID=1735272 RepID=UPI001B88D284|nr:uncharacterized protein LOC121372210 [Gigantopelta aegis]
MPNVGLTPCPWPTRPRGRLPPCSGPTHVDGFGLNHYSVGRKRDYSYDQVAKVRHSPRNPPTLVKQKSALPNLYNRSQTEDRPRKKSGSESPPWYSDDKKQFGASPRARSKSSSEQPSVSDMLESKSNEEGLKPEIIKLERKKSAQLPTVGMHKHRPTSGALCFTVKWMDASHEDVKDAIESQLSCVIDRLRLDPMDKADTEHKTMWVFTVKGATLNNQALQQGIKLNGERSRIRYLDDVMLSEHNAYIISSPSKTKNR